MNNPKLWMYIIAVTVAAMILDCLTSCRTMRTVTVEQVRTDTLLVTKEQRDSVWLHDSIYHFVKGDTVLIERWHTKYRDRLVHDTTYISRTDSATLLYEVIREVPAKLTVWQRVRQYLEKIGLCVLALIVGGWIVKSKFY